MSLVSNSFSGHKPAQRKCARTPLRSHARCHPYPISQPVKVGHTTGVYDPHSFRIVMWVLLRPTRTNQGKCCETGPTVFRPYPRRLESLTICRCRYKGSTFFSVIQRPWVLVRTGFEPATSHSADRRSPNWANQAAVRFHGRTFRFHGRCLSSPHVLSVIGAVFQYFFRFQQRHGFIWSFWELGKTQTIFQIIRYDENSLFASIWGLGGGGGGFWLGIFSAPFL